MGVKTKKEELTEDELVRSIFLELADLLEYLGENRFKVLAYRRAVKSIESSGKSIRELLEKGELTKLPNVGEVVEKKTREILETGKLRKLEEVRAKIPENIREMIIKLPISPSSVATLVKAGVDSMKKLREMVLDGRINSVQNLSKRTINRLRKYFESNA
ncbi:hypothetical protein J7J62_02675 [bacterium]|nr:hypothetical protein [bacterium]